MNIDFPAHAGLQPLWRKCLLYMLLLTGILFLAACSEQKLQSNLNEQDANEIIAVLNENGVSAGKTAADEGKWDITVGDGDFAKSVALLQARGLPRTQSDTLCSAFQPSGFGETPLSQQARLVCATQNDIARTITEIDGVVSARVQLGMPEPNASTGEVKPTTASVLVKYRSGFDVRQHTSGVKTLVANGVDGLAPDNVSVMMVAAASGPPAAAKADGANGGSLLRIFAILAALALLGLALKAWSARRKKSNSKVPAPMDGNPAE
ncbi:type III secretion system inner membrane ring lipoprotein SctJ [Sphingorhabdus arenilitoris]|uniref:Lipoprotein n=1 Tax=Sphingorhabdus arenilitoris TaxID=1490041 RepID=A0ABV8RI95_9SPHN